MEETDAWLFTPHQLRSIKTLSECGVSNVDIAKRMDLTVSQFRTMLDKSGWEIGITTVREFRQSRLNAVPLGEDEEPNGNNN